MRFFFDLKLPTSHEHYKLVGNFKSALRKYGESGPHVPKLTSTEANLLYNIDLKASKKHKNKKGTHIMTKSELKNANGRLRRAEKNKVRSVARIQAIDDVRVVAIADNTPTTNYSGFLAANVVAMQGMTNSTKSRIWLTRHWVIALHTDSRHSSPMRMAI